MELEWDPRKAAANLKKHGVDFNEAVEAFFDPNAIDDFDSDHSTVNEQRFALIGLSSRRLLLVIFTERRGNRIRIISARKASKVEERLYNHAKS